MCRFVAYQGHELSLADLLYRSRHSLVAQSAGAEQMSQTFNGDGFGTGWYTSDADPLPCVVKQAGPAWSNENARRIAPRIHSRSIFGHIRAASPGMPVQESNCHPFFDGRLMFMHNGAVAGFHRFKRRLQESLSDHAFQSIGGGTDSEHAFAVLLDELGYTSGDLSAGRLRAATVGTLRRLIELAHAVGVSPEMYCNFAVTDGRSLVATRFACENAREPASLHYSVGERYVIDGGDGDMLGTDTTTPGAVIVASEPLTRSPTDWRHVPANHSITVTPSLRVRLDPIEV